MLISCAWSPCARSGASSDAGVNMYVLLRARSWLTYQGLCVAPNQGHARDHRAGQWEPAGEPRAPDPGIHHSNSSVTKDPKLGQGQGWPKEALPRHCSDWETQAQGGGGLAQGHPANQGRAGLGSSPHALGNTVPHVRPRPCGSPRNSRPRSWKVTRPLPTSMRCTRALR